MGDSVKPVSYAEAAFSVIPLWTGVMCTIKSLRKLPLFRFALVPFTAVWTSIAYRDDQVERRRALVNLIHNQKLRLDIWREIPNDMRENGIRNSKKDLHLMRRCVWKTSEWDVVGKVALKHELDTCYSSQAVLCKALICGMTLGILPMCSKLGGFFSDTWADDPFFYLDRCALFLSPHPEQLNMKPGDQDLLRYWRCLALTAHVCQKGVLFQNTPMACRNSVHFFRSQPLSVYARDSFYGKLPIFQFDLENDEYYDWDHDLDEMIHLLGDRERSTPDKLKTLCT